MPEINSIYDNRELSWLKFNKRVLEEAADENVPLMERFLFEAIFSNNLDEFFMVRTGTLINRMLDDDSVVDNKTGLRPSEQLSLIYAELRKLLPERDRLNADIERRLADNGIRRLGIDRLSPEQREYADNFFDHRIMPFLNKYILYEGERFPFLENRHIYTAVRFERSSRAGLAIISDTEEHERTLFLPSENGRLDYILAEDLILANIHRLFEDCVILEKLLIRATRSAAVTLDDEPNTRTDRLEAMSMVLAKRRLMPVLRLQLSAEPSQLLKDTLSSVVEVGSDRVFTERAPLDPGFVSELYARTADRVELHYKPMPPVYPNFTALELSFFELIARKDLLLSYPYDSIEPFIKMLDEAAENSSVCSINITLYRVADDSRIINALCEAARNGIAVTVCTELRARFDEQHNIKCAERLKAAGCDVIYGIPGIKVHSKLCLVVYRQDGRLKYITQIGTGNYNEKTAAQYTDFSLITADTEIALDAERVFVALKESRLVSDTTSLLISPISLRPRILALIDDEIRAAQNGDNAYFGAKMNGLSDKLVIDKLIEASQAGVKIELAVRGICCLVAGVEGYTDNIRIVSIVGRFLEHSRLYIFGRSDRTRVYISSADLMTRNTCRRIEAAAPIKDPDIKARLIAYFDTQLSDDVNARVQQPDGSYLKLYGGNLNSQERFYAEALAAAQPSEMQVEPVVQDQPELNDPSDSIPQKEKFGFFKWLISFFRRKK